MQGRKTDAGTPRSATSFEFPASNSPLNRHAHQIPPLRPTAIVIPHVRVAQQVFQHKPGVAGAFTDAAIDDDAVGCLQALLQLVKLVRNSSAVLKVPSSGFAALAHGTLTAPLMCPVRSEPSWYTVLHVEEVHCVQLAGAADIHQWQADLDVFQDVVAEGANLVVGAIGRMIFRDRHSRHTSISERPSFSHFRRPPSITAVLVWPNSSKIHSA